MISRSFGLGPGQAGGGYQSGRSIHKCLRMDLAGRLLLQSKSLASHWHQLSFHKLYLMVLAHGAHQTAEIRLKLSHHLSSWSQAGASFLTARFVFPTITSNGTNIQDYRNTSHSCQFPVTRAEL
jgi:hypothetical protein